MIVAILQARLSSSRLPGKVLLPILGRPMLALHLERLLRCRKFDLLKVATSTEPEDGRIDALCNKMGIACYRGALNDVLERFYGAAASHQPDHVVRLTGDCPLADPVLIDNMIQFHLNGKYDYTANALEPTYPDGLDVEVIRWPCVEQARRNAHLPSEREHVTPYIYRHPGDFHIGHYKSSENHSELRWTVDQEEDFEFVARVYENLYPEKPDFSTDDILHLLDKQPDLVKINAGISRNKGMLKSIEEDRRHKARNLGKEG